MLFSRLTLPVQQLTTIKNSHRNLSFKQTNAIKSIINRNFAWFAKQTVKPTFGV